MRLVDKLKFVTGIPPGILKGDVGTGARVSLKNNGHMTMVVTIDNASTVTGTTVALKQAKNVSGGGEKALNFDKVWQNIDTAASNKLVEAAVSSNTFTTDATNGKNLKYLMEINATDLDVSDGYDVVRIECDLMVGALGSVEYILSESRQNPALAQSAISD